MRPAAAARLRLAAKAIGPRVVEAFVEEHQAEVFRLAVSVLGDAAEAEEATQDALIAALSGLDTYRGDASLTTWLYAITLNTCRARLRKRRSRERLAEMLHSVLRLGGDSARQPEEAAIRSESGATVLAAINALDDRHRLPVVLRYYGDCSTAEIAQILGISEGTVHSRLFTARERLRAALQGRPGTGEGRP
jgi:RNA polymerase sigma-70 factor (ECF subfamily)